ncbi:MAG: acyltransferase family protein [Sulfitobacter sp.]
MNIPTRKCDKSYRPDIDGLRAIAVIAVISGHTFEGRFPGGYLGVDVFFVISGFVITHSLFSREDQRLGRFIAAFSLRRIKRLLPALLVCIGLTCVALLVLDSTPKTSLRTGAAALFGISNFSLYLQELDYFSASTRYNAFTHTWSLGVEEQFYLVFPLIFWFVFQPSSSKNQRAFLFLILSFSTISLVGFFALQASAPMAAYYMMPLRFWELGLGVAAATALHQGNSDTVQIKRYLNPLALIAVLTVFFVIPLDVRALGHLAVVVVTTVLLLVGANPNAQSHLLTNRLMRYVGNISYSLYLWHWPFLTFGLLAPYGFFANPFLAILCAIIAAILSYHLVEQPVRKFKTPTPRLWHFAAALLSVFLVIGSVAAGNDYRKSLGLKPIEAALRPDFHLLPGSDLPFNPTCVVDGQNRLLQSDTFEKCTFLPKPGGDSRTLWVMGDSHAGHLQGALLKLRDEYGFGVHLIETPGNTYPVINPQGFSPRETLFKETQEHWKPGDIVVLSRLYLSREDPLRVLRDVPQWLEMVDFLADDLRQSGIDLLLIGPPPMFSFEDIRACVPADVKSCSIPREGLEVVITEVHQQLSQLAGQYENVAMLDIFEHLCPRQAPICGPTQNGVFQFRDRDHLNTEGAAMLSEFFYRVLNEAY